MNILRQKDKKVQTGLFEKFADSSVIDKIHSGSLLNVAVQSKYNTLLVLILELVVPKKYSLIIYSLKLILYFCCEFKEVRFFLLSSCVLIFINHIIML